jgi:hypothetical protein
VRWSLDWERAEQRPRWTRERVPLDWAGTQANFGIALTMLGERGIGTEKLNEAVAAYGAALEVYTRERVPLLWASVQTNLGNALGVLGERESGTEKLGRAVAVLHVALEELTRERVPLDWAMTQTNLGAALVRLGERESGTARLKRRSWHVAPPLRNGRGSGFRFNGRRAALVHGYADAVS